jgi:predicted signal transduction protein with EAL and GGDEF domain
MLSDSLIGALPDLVIGVRRDGVILAVNAGHGVGDLRPPAESIGQSIGTIWPEAVASLIRQLARKAISTRRSTDARFSHGGREYEARASAQGPDKAVCLIRAVSGDSLAETVDATAERLAPQIDRRGFIKRFKESTAIAALREKPLSVAVIHIDGLADIAQSIAPKVSEQILTSAILRLSQANHDPQAPAAAWYLGQLSDSLLALVLEAAQHDIIERSVEQVCASLREPVRLATETYQLTPSAGVAVMGPDGTSARGLLDNARVAANEARRGEGGRICFCSETLRLKSLERLDIARELHDAIENGDVQLRYVGRHDLSSGKLVAWMGYLRWIHPLRGEIADMDLLKVAQSTGLGAKLSRSAMQGLQDDYRRLSTAWDRDVRISFGALRHQLADDHFIADFDKLLAAGIIPPQRLEVRIPERNITALSPEDLRPLARRGVQLIVEDVGQGPPVLDWLARAPVQGLQFDPSLILAAVNDPWPCASARPMARSRPPWG